MKAYLYLFVAVIVVFIRKYLFLILLVAGLIVGYRYFSMPSCLGTLLTFSAANVEGDMEPFSFSTQFGTLFFEPTEAGTFCLEIKKVR